MDVQPYLSTDLMPFGKYKDLPLSEVSCAYLLYRKDTTKDKRLEAYIKENYDALVSELNETIERGTPVGTINKYMI